MCAPGFPLDSAIAIAAAVSGDSVHSVPWSSNVERLRAALHAGKEEGSYVVFNEIAKDIRGKGRTLQDGLGFLLNLTTDSLSHKLYIGPVHLGSLPVCVLTDTSLPVEVVQHSKIARLLLGIDLMSEMFWESTIKDHGISRIVDLRLAGDQFAAACDVILSGVIDEFFGAPTTFEDIATALGFRKLENNSEMEEKRDTLRTFYAHVTAAPEATGADLRRWGATWRVIERHHQTDLADLWRQLADEGWGTSEKCTETDWAALLRVPGPITFESRSHGGKVAVRFRSKHDNVGLATETPCVHRPGNPIASEPQDRRWEGVPTLASHSLDVSCGEA